MYYMNHILKILLISSIIPAMSGCGEGAKEKKGNAGDLKVKLEKLKKEKNDLDAEIRSLEEQMSSTDSGSSGEIKKLVSIDTLQLQNFAHYIELQGKVDADNMAYVAPSGQGGMVKAVYVKLGSRVKKGQIILKLDDALPRQQVVAAQQQADVIKGRLVQAQTVYEKYKNLWNENIGTEIQVINAKADVDALQSQLNAARAQVAQAQELVNMSNVSAQISGVIDEMNVKPGEFFSPQTAAQPGMGIRIVNNNQLKVVTQVPDNYVAKVRKGDKVLVSIPETGRPAYESFITTIGASIDAKTRSFTTEARLPSDPLLKPNQTAVMKILDYEVKDAVIVPVNVVQTDDKGKFVYVASPEGDKMTARKKSVIVGEVAGINIEIKSGLNKGDVIITDAYQSVYDGQRITTGN
jgi:RND family efflux transporter MFP subunit